MNTLKQIQTLYDQELYSNVIHLAELTISMSEQKLDLSPSTKYEIYILYADSLYHAQRFLHAESAYGWALQIRKYMAKTKAASKQTPENQKETPKDIEVNIKYKLYLCYMKLRWTEKGIDILQSIPARLRTPKINMALGDLYMEAGMDRSAATCYKEVLRENPYALLASEKLLKLGVKGIEVNSLIIDAVSDNTWISAWLRGQAQMHSKEYANAISTFKSIEALKDNTNLLVTIAYCYVYLCDTRNALQVLQKVSRLDPNFITGRDLLATTLAQPVGYSCGKEEIRELERIATTELDTARYFPEHWVALGWYMYTLKKYEKAAYFSHQACQMDKNNVEAAILKAHTLIAVLKFVDASLLFKDAVHLAPNRYEAHVGLVESTYALTRMKEALSMAANACKLLNNSPQSLTLYATMMMRDPPVNSKVRNLLEKAIADDPSYLPAICLFADYLENEQRHEEACQMLQKHVDKYPSARAHLLLAESYTRVMKNEEAFTHFNSVLRLDPQNQRALEGLNRIGKGSNNLLDISGDFHLPSTPELNYVARSLTENLEECDLEQWSANNSDFMAYE